MSVVTFRRSGFHVSSLTDHATIAIRHISKLSKNQEIEAIRALLRTEEKRIRSEKADVKNIHWSLLKEDNKEITFLAVTALLPQPPQIQEDEPDLSSEISCEVVNTVETEEAAAAPPPLPAPSPALIQKSDEINEINYFDVVIELFIDGVKLTLLPFRILLELLSYLVHVNPKEAVAAFVDFFGSTYRLVQNINRTLEGTNALMKNLTLLTARLKEMAQDEAAKVKEALDNIVKMLKVIQSIDGKAEFVAVKAQFQVVFEKINVMLSEMLLDGPVGMLRGLADDRRQKLERDIAELKRLPPEERLEKMTQFSKTLQALLLEVGRAQDAAAVQVPTPIKV